MVVEMVGCPTCGPHKLGNGDPLDALIEAQDQIAKLTTRIGELEAACRDALDRGEQIRSGMRLPGGWKAVVHDVMCPLWKALGIGP